MNILDIFSDAFLSSLSPQQSECLLRDLDASGRNTTIEALCSWMHTFGWQVVQHPNKRLRVFQRTANGQEHPHILYLPVSRHFSKAEEQITEAVRILAKVHHLSPWHIIMPLEIWFIATFRAQQQ